MPLSSPKRKVSDVENKLRVLLCLKAIGMATQEQLWPFVARLELMEYIPFCLLLDELKLNGSVAQGVGAVSGMLYLTAEGERTLELFGRKLVETDRRRILLEAPAYAARLNERRHLQAAYERPEGERFRALCAVKEEDVPTLLVRAASPNSALTKQLVKDFAALAPRLMALLYALPPAKDASALPLVSPAQALEEAAPAQPRLCCYGGANYGAAVQAEQEGHAYTLLLLWPDAASAQSWAISADRLGPMLAEKLTGLIQNGEAEP